MNWNDQNAVPGTGGHGENPSSNAAQAPISVPAQQLPPNQQQLQSQPGQQPPQQQGWPASHNIATSITDGAARLLSGSSDSADSQPDHDDDVWVDRAKRAIAETQNDPYRQVQLLQHLNRLYLKERFNRDVHSEDGK